MKRFCTKCQKTKPASSFTRSVKKKRLDGTLVNDGYESHCKACKVKRTLAYRRKHPDIATKQRFKTKQKYLEKRKAYYKTHPEMFRNSRLVKKYGITLDEYNTMMKNQGYKCAICGVPELECTKGLYVDHNHETKIIRGLLCEACNFMLGKAKENPNILRIGAMYLDRFTLSKSKPAENKKEPKKK